MKLCSALFLVSLLGLAQAPAPQPAPELDQALRARVNEFFQDFVDGKFRAAMDLVADDTQEAYLAAGKAEIKNFKIMNIEYAPDLERANVKMQVRRIWNIQGQPNEVDTEMPTTWKIEKGRWVWTQQLAPSQWLTPMGPSDVQAVTKNANGTIMGVPPRGITQQMVDAAAKNIFKQAGPDKSQVTLASDKASSDKIVFHNGAPGSIQLELQAPQVSGLSVKLNKTTLGAQEDATLEVSYTPPASGGAPPRTALRLTVIPFNQSFEIGVQFK